jgi:glycerol-3-phosphate dehydrogenase (NAD+)
MFEHLSAVIAHTFTLPFLKCRWLVEAQDGKASTINGLAGIGDICLTCYGNLSRNRAVGIRLGQGEELQTILASSSQV